MELNIKEKIDEVVGKIKNDPNLMEEFKKDPIKTLEGILGVDLPDEQMKVVVDGVKSKISGEGEGIGGMVEKLEEKIGELFGKK